jgi:hypothetical protein
MVSGMRVLKRAVLACAALAFICFWDPFLLWSEGATAVELPLAEDAAPHYVGAGVCAECHRSIAADQHTTAMANALERTAESVILRANPRMTFRSGAFTYQIVRQGNQSIYTVTDGVDTISEPILYTFGRGKAGQTYVYKHEGAFYESRVSFYKDIKGLDLTIGHLPPVKVPLKEAAGREQHPDEVTGCFSCHATAAVAGGKLQLEQLVPGVSCESCHGPGSDHVAAINAGEFEKLKISNPGRLSPDELSQDFCGKCHRSAERVIFMPQQAGINNVRFQPYRIFGSKCYTDDKRISCIACHNPHQDPKSEAAFYDAKCLACHVSKAKTQLAVTPKPSEPPCPVGTKDCVTCHMPKIEIPGSHFAFTDHRIRVARAGEPFPN